MITITVQGKAEFVDALNKGADRFQDFRPTLQKIGDETFSIIRRRFDAQGPGWPALSPAYAAQKARRFPGKPILRASDALYASFVKGSRGNINRISKLEGEFGSSDAKAMFHQTGTQRMPARPILEISGDNELRFTNILIDDLSQGFQQVGFVVS